MSQAEQVAFTASTTPEDIHHLFRTLSVQDAVKIAERLSHMRSGHPLHPLQNKKFVGLDRGPRDKLKEIGYRLLRSKKNYEGLVGIACLALAYYHRAAIYAENELSRSPPTLRGPFPSFDTYLTHALPSSSALPDEARNSRWFDWLLAEPLAAPGSLTVAGDWRPDAAWREYRAALTAGFVGKAPDDARRGHMEQQRRDSREESDRWDRERDRQQVLRPSQPSDPMFDLPLPWDT